MFCVVPDAPSKKTFKSNPRLLNSFHVILLMNRQPELARPVNNHICNFHRLDLGILRFGDVGKLKKFFNGKEYDRDQASRMVLRLLGDVILNEKSVGHQLTVFVLEMSEHVRNSIVDGFCCVITDICEIRFLNTGNDLLHKSLIDSHHFSKQAHLLSVSYSNVRIHVGGCSVRDKY